MSDQNERALVERLRERDEHALAELASIYGHKIFQLAFRYLRNHEDAEEVVQDVLLKVFRKIDAFRGDSALSSWIYRITFNTAMSRLRRTKAMRHCRGERNRDRHGRATTTRWPRSIQPTGRTWPTSRCCKSQLRERLAAAVVGLPAIYREPVILRDFNGLSTEEASTKLRVKDQTLKSRLHRGTAAAARTAGRFRGRAVDAHKRSSRDVERSLADCRFEADPIARRECRRDEGREPGGLQRHRHHRRSARRAFVAARRRRAPRAREACASTPCGPGAPPRRQARKAPAATIARCARRAAPAAPRSALRSRSCRRSTTSSHGTMICCGGRPSTDSEISGGAAPASSDDDRGDGRSQRLRRRAEQPHPRDAKLVDAALDEARLRRAGADDRRELVEAGDTLDQRQAAFVLPFG